MEAFMDDFSVHDAIFDNCLVNIEKVLAHCVVVDLVLNWEKCHLIGHFVDGTTLFGSKISITL
jgi:hypothetical protein